MVATEFQFTPADARAAVLAGRGGLFAFLLVAVGLFTVVRTDGPILIRLVSWGMVILVFLVLVLFWTPRRIAKRLTAPLTWTFSDAGIRVEAAGADTTIDWARVKTIIIRPGFVHVKLQRSGSSTLGLPRRALDPSELDAVTTLATAHDVPVKQGWILG